MNEQVENSSNNLLNNSLLNFNYENDPTTIEKVSCENRNLFNSVDDKSISSDSCNLENINLTTNFLEIDSTTGEILDDLIKTIVADFKVETDFTLEANSYENDNSNLAIKTQSTSKTNGNLAVTSTPMETAAPPIDAPKDVDFFTGRPHSTPKTYSNARRSSASMKAPSPLSDISKYARDGNFASKPQSTPKEPRRSSTSKKAVSPQAGTSKDEAKRARRSSTSKTAVPPQADTSKGAGDDNFAGKPQSTPEDKAKRPRRSSSSKKTAKPQNESQDEEDDDKDSDYDVDSDADKSTHRLREILSPKNISELKSMEITVTEDEIEPQHMLESKITRPPSVEVKKTFLRFRKLKKGRYSPAEDRIIRNNWNNFCMEYNWNKKNVQPFLLLKYKGYFLLSEENRLKFIRILAKGLPDRTLYSIYKRFKIIFKSYKKEKRFLKREDMKIWKFIRNFKTDPNRFKRLSMLMNRNEASILKRYRLLKKKKLKNKGMIKRVDWNLTSVGIFVKELMDATLSETIEELKDASIPKVVWLRLQRRLKIPYDVLMNIWSTRLHLQLFSPGIISQNMMKIILIEYLYRNGISDRREINWMKITQYIDGATVPYLCQLLVTLLSSVKSKTFSDAVKKLHKITMPGIINSKTDKYLPRLRYENGKMEMID